MHSIECCLSITGQAHGPDMGGMACHMNSVSTTLTAGVPPPWCEHVLSATGP